MIAVQGANGGPPIGVIVVSIMGAIPILGIMAWAAVKIFGPLGQALALRLGGGSHGNPQLEERVERLAEELDRVKGELAETHERLDFTERLLAQSRTPDQLPRG